MSIVTSRLHVIKQWIAAFCNEEVWQLNCSNGKVFTRLRRDHAEKLQNLYGGKLSLMK